MTQRHSRLLLLLGFFLLTATLIVPFPKHSYAATPDFDNYMIQDVCVSPAGAVTSIDPYTCPLSSGYSRRDLGVGENLPYHKHDQPDANNQYGFQISDSFPLRHPDGTLRYVNTLDFFSFGTSYIAPREFNFDVSISNTHYPWFDGYNVNEGNGSYAAIIGTADPIGGIQPIWGSNCALADSWLLFPTNVTNLVFGSTIAHLRIANTCPQQLDSSVTLWDKYSGLTYTSGKTLASITSWHYGTATTIEQSTHIEKFFFTREYGLTRWERWERATNIPTPTAKTAGCNGYTQDPPPPQQAQWVRTDCRDWTNIQPDPNGGYSPYNIPIDSRFAPNNLLINGDFGRGQFTEGQNWSRINQSSIMDWQINQNNPTNPNDPDGWNHHLAMKCRGSCFGNAVYQDVPRGTIPNGAVIKFGGTIWADQNAQMAFTLFLLDASGGIRQRKDITLNVGTGKQRFADQITISDVSGSTAWFRYTFYPLTTNTMYRVDDNWLVRGL